jgi:hypothetical protein
MATRTAALAVEVTSRVTDGVRGLHEVGDAGKQAGNELDNAGRKSGRFSSAVRTGAKVAAAGLLAVAAGALSSARAAAADASSQSRLAQQLRTGAGATAEQIRQNESWITTQGKLLGVADDELRPALARLATATGSVSKAQRLASLAMNISASTGKPLKTVTEALAKAQTGSLGGLSKLGVNTKDAAGHTRTLSALTGELAAKYKGAAAKNADTIAGKQKILTVQLGELQEQIGAKLLPVMNTLVTVGLKVVDWASRNAAIVKPLLIGLGILAGLVLAVAAAQRVYNAGALVYTAITKGAAAATTALRTAQFLLNLAFAVSPIGVIVLAVVALIAVVVIAYKRSATFRSIVTGAFHAVRAAAVFAFNWVRDNWPLLLAIITGPIGLAVLAVVKNWDKITAKVRDVKKFITDKVGQIPGDLAGIARDIGETLLAPFQNVIDLVQRLIDKIKSIKLPHLDLNPLNGRVTGGTSSGGGFTTVVTTTPSGPVTNNYYTFNVSGLLTDDEAAAVIQQIITRNARLFGATA